MADAPPPVMAVHCPRCDSPGVCTTRGTLDRFDPSDGLPERWSLLSCPHGHPLLVVQSKYYPDMAFDDDTPYRVYPAQDRQLSDLIPEELRSAHEEARRCFNSKAFTAAVVMSGRVLEGACKLQGVSERTLQKSLDKLHQLGVIDGRLAAWAQALRQVRNAAAHYSVERIDRQDAEDAIAYNEALLDYLYVLKDRFEAMKARRATSEE
jgi:hypothetical protein